MHCSQYASNYVQSFFVYIDISKKEIPSGYTFCENGLFEYTELKNDIIRLINILFLFQAFIIRQSSQSNTLALSVSEQDIIEHYLIEPSKQCSDKLSLESSDHSFDNVLSLVYHYSTTK